MNYIAELNYFYARLLVRPLSSEAQALWGVLMHLFNRAGWPPQLTVAASTLLGLLGYSYATLSRARTELITAGLLTHTPRPGRLAPYYELQPMNTKPVDKTVNNPVDKPRLALVKPFCQS
ncbi:hypothetical protein EV210_103297 [Anaerospora hongkongensis]|uniref:Helix-turn-helix protein n=1 Tax=Anaerospora hongkongensis TaxID=244830 RepID=A0A4R1Q0F9_9FIRM|nr:hypothetical protein [Anaerospora hongkongensis]TCL38813.1 hypothetical protein EV210_103297 [Anaerospora hongkongensis]